MRSRALMRPWWPHFGQTLRFFSRSVRYSTASHAGHLTQSPSGIDFLVTPGVALIRGGKSFCNQLISSLRQAALLATLASALRTVPSHPAAPAAASPARGLSV